MAPDEYIAEVWFPTPPSGARGAYVKVGRRKAQAISLVSVGVQMTPDDGHVRVRAWRLGAVAPAVIRATAAEQALGASASRLTSASRRPASLPLKPGPSAIFGPRPATGARLVQTWVRRALEACL